MGRADDLAVRLADLDRRAAPRRDRRARGNSKLEVSRSGGQLGGPALGGLLVSTITAPYAVLVDALSFAWSGLLVKRIRRREEPHEAPPERSMRREVVEGLRYIVGDPRWRAIALYVAVSNFFFSVAFSIFLVYAVRELDWSARLIGIVLALGNVGWLVGAVFASRVSTRVGIGRTLVLAGAITGSSVLLIPLAPKHLAVPFILAAQNLVALGIVLYNVTAISLMQALTPQRILGRMNASRRWIVWGTIPLGNLVGGVLAEWVGLRETIFVGAIGASLSFFFLTTKPLRTIERLPEPSEPRSSEELLGLPLVTKRAEI